MSIRSRLLLVTIGVLGLGLGILLVAGNLLFAHTVSGDTAQLLRTRAEAQIAALRVTPRGITVRAATNDEALDSRAWIMSQSRVIERPAATSPSLDRLAVALGRRGRPATATGPGNVRLLATPLNAPGGRQVVGAVVVGASTATFDQLQRKLLWGSLLGAGLVLLAAAVAVRRALLAALRPVQRMTSDAEDWGAHDLDRRFDLGPPKDEITGLAATLDHLLERIAGSRRHEQRFAADVAHELRTPVARIRGYAELGATEDSRAALIAIGEAAERLTATIDTLLAHVRRELDPQEGSVDLRAVVAEFDGVDMRSADSLPLAEGDPEIVQRAIAPLIDNARRHARAAPVRVELTSSDGRLRAAVRDDGPGIDPALSEEIFEPGVRGPGEPDGGAGLGLPLARRLARACGGEVRVGSGPGGCFILELPARETNGKPA